MSQAVCWAQRPRWYVGLPKRIDSVFANYFYIVQLYH